MRSLWLSILLVLLVGATSCRPVPPRGLPRDPGQALSSTRALERPVQIQVEGRFRTELGGIAMDLGMAMLADRVGNARVDLDYPFGGRAMTLNLSEGGALLGTAPGSDRVLFTPDVAPLMSGALGEEARTAQVVDLLLGRLPEGFEGEVSWERRERQTVLAVRMDDGRVAILGLEGSPAHLERMTILDADEGIVATASWSDWAEFEGYWLPASVELTFPGALAPISMSFRQVDTAPEVPTGAYEIAAPEGDYQPFESLLGPG